jgi:hypothetical protein
MVEMATAGSSQSRPAGAKIGEFDWIADFAQLEPHINRASGACEVPKHEQKVLIIGCGTSPMSAALAQCGFNTIVSLDNDEECVRHMAALYTDDRRLRWLHYDVVTKEGTDAAEVNTLKEAFDIIIDKGTLDAIMVEGSCWEMLSEVYRLMRPQGHYLLCSIHSYLLLQNLLSIPSLNLSPQICSPCDPLNPSSSCVGTVVLCRRSKTSVRPEDLDLISMVREEEEVMNKHFKVEQPYLTAELAVKIRGVFELAVKQGLEDGLPFKEAHRVMFDDDAASDYSYDLFMEDLSSYPLRKEGVISVDEALAFIEQMQ